jgi:hypothetical protein
MDGQLSRLDELLITGLLNQTLGRCFRLTACHQPPGCIATKDIENHIEVEIGPPLWPEERRVKPRELGRPPLAQNHRRASRQPRSCVSVVLWALRGYARHPGYFFWTSIMSSACLRRFDRCTFSLFSCPNSAAKGLGSTVFGPRCLGLKVSRAPSSRFRRLVVRLIVAPPNPEERRQ